MADRTRFRLIESQVQQLQQFAERMQRSIDELQNELKSEKIESREQMKRVYENTEVEKRVASLSPYGKWVQENLRILKPTNYLSSTVFDNDATLRRQQAYGYYSEDLQMVIETMDSQGKEPTFCMGDDIPLAALPQRPHLL